MMQVIGLTGGIASGKSTVARMFAELGAQTASADEDARAVVEPGSPTLAEVFEAFPEARAADGITLDRTALARRIFADPEARRTLEAITHPAIFARMQEEMARARSSHEKGLLLYEVPLLYEKQREGMFDAVVAVLASPAAQAVRLQEREARAGRPPLSPEAITERRAAQMSPEEKARRADYVIRTDVPLEETRDQVEAVWRALVGGSAIEPSPTPL